MAQLDTFGLKPISKADLIRCIESAYRGGGMKELVEEIRRSDFQGVLIGVEPGGDHNQLKGVITDEPITEKYENHGGKAVRAAILTVLGEGAEDRFFLEFSSSISLQPEA